MKIPGHATCTPTVIQGYIYGCIVTLRVLYTPIVSPKMSINTQKTTQYTNEMIASKQLLSCVVPKGDSRPIIDRP